MIVSLYPLPRRDRNNFRYSTFSKLELDGRRSFIIPPGASPEATEFCQILRDKFGPRATWIPYSSNTGSILGAKADFEDLAPLYRYCVDEHYQPLFQPSTAPIDAPGVWLDGPLPDSAVECSEQYSLLKSLNREYGTMGIRMHWLWMEIGWLKDEKLKHRIDDLAAWGTGVHSITVNGRRIPIGQI